MRLSKSKNCQIKRVKFYLKTMIAKGINKENFRVLNILLFEKIKTEHKHFLKLETKQQNNQHK